MLKGNGSLFPQDIKDLWTNVEVTKLDDRNLKFTIPEPFAPFGAPGDFDDAQMHHPCALHVDDLLRVWYTGDGGTPKGLRIGLAHGTSPFVR